MIYPKLNDLVKTMTEKEVRTLFTFAEQRNKSILSKNERRGQIEAVVTSRDPEKASVGVFALLGSLVEQNMTYKSLLKALKGHYKNVPARRA